MQQVNEEVDEEDEAEELGVAEMAGGDRPGSDRAGNISNDESNSNDGDADVTAGGPTNRENRKK